MQEFEIVIINAIATILCDESSSEKLIKLRFSALQNVLSCLKVYTSHNYDSKKLLLPIAIKKSQWIMAATTKKDMDQIIKPPKPIYNGAGFYVGSFATEEEECILRSETSLRGPLISAGQERYIVLFKKLFPDEHIGI